VLPLVREAFHSKSRTTIKAFEVLIGLFNESEMQESEIESIDNKVCVLYILPKVNELLKGN
jgi:hypothetical protein